MWFVCLKLSKTYECHNSFCKFATIITQNRRMSQLIQQFCYMPTQKLRLPEFILQFCYHGNANNVNVTAHSAILLYYECNKCECHSWFCNFAILIKQNLGMSQLILQFCHHDRAKHRMSQLILQVCYSMNTKHANVTADSAILLFW